MTGEPLNQFFGEPWDASVIDGLTQGDTPTWEPCLWCDEAILFGDQGFWQMCIDTEGARVQPIHRECAFRSLSGSVGHILEQCACFGGSTEDPEGFSKRQAAVAAWQIAEVRSAIESVP